MNYSNKSFFVFARKSSLAVALTGVIVAANVLGGSAGASSMTESAQAKLTGRRIVECSISTGNLCNELDKKNQLSARVQLNHAYSDIENICLVTTFGKKNSKALSPNEEISFNGAYGALNVSSDPQTQRTLCFNNESHSDFVASFKDGEELLTVSSNAGKFQIRSIEVQVTGSRI